MMKTIDFNKIQNIVGSKHINDRNGWSGSSINTSTKETTNGNQSGSSANSLQRKYATNKDTETRHNNKMQFPLSG